MGIYSDYPGNLYKNEGVYNSRGIYKEGAGGGGGGDIIFLTYFDNFDASTGTDIPIVGDPYTLDVRKQALTRSSLNLFGSTCPALKDEYKEVEYTGFSKIIPEDVEFISAELFILCEGTGSQYGSLLSFGVDNLTLDPYYSSTEFGIFGPYYSGSSSNYTMFNGTIRSNTNYFQFGKNIRFKISHLASTYDVKNKITRFYVDGDIMLEIRNYYEMTSYKFGVRQNNTGKSFTITGVAYFSYDKSTNDGMNYPVPTERYY
jgi:hypothetical protein